MLDNLANYFGTTGFMPHGHCFFWTPSLLWIYVVSDFIIAASYFSIPFALWYFVQKRPDVPFRWMFLMFGAFVLACGKLSPLEFRLIQAHPQASHDVLKDVELPWPVAEVALQHHERMDGSGYPQGLKGEAILFEARIMAVADVVEAMSSHRPYRPGLGIEAALVEIERGRGSAYDPVVADACLRLFREKAYAIPA